MQARRVLQASIYLGCSAAQAPTAAVGWRSPRLHSGPSDRKHNIERVYSVQGGGRQGLHSKPWAAALVPLRRRQPGRGQCLFAGGLTGWEPLHEQLQQVGSRPLCSRQQRQ